ncbi:MAG: sulfatase-like hydrolase/transferase [Bacteroidia bacterium]|nr:sulfatase-like hydrolase/transferase [Bacteroidia bacterium]
MKRKLLYLLRLFVFWLVFFQVSRAIFVLYNYDKFTGCSKSEILYAFLHAWPLDFSAACYLLAVPFLIALASNYIHLLHVTKALSAFNYVMLALLTIINLADTALYHEWGYKLNAYALSFTRYPKEVMASMKSIPYLLILAIIGAMVAGFGILLRKTVHLHDYPLKNNVITGTKRHVKGAAVFLCTLFLLFTGIRGGLGVVPINQSAVFFSGKPVLNHTALNTGWNLMNSYVNAGKTSTKNSYQYLKAEDAKNKIDELYKSNNSFPSVIGTEKPNILFIVLESWTADVIEDLGGEAGLTDGFKEATKEGLLFSNIYANGDRTDKGIVAILSAYPSQTQTSIITQAEKMEKLPSILFPFIDNGYQTAFYYGGESDFANMKAYLFHCGFSKIIDKNAFESKDMNSKWGAHDGVVFSRVLTDLNSEKKPFVYTVLSLSSHEPFEIPVPSKIKSNKEADLFRNAIWYSDQCLHHFLTEAKQQSWYKNTLIVMVADHGHRLPANYTDLSVPGKFRIPVLFTGGALLNEYRGKVCTKTGNQTDLAKTILDQVRMPAPASTFRWSKNLLDSSSKDFAFYTFNDGIGWVYKGEQLVFDNISKQITYPYTLTKADSTIEKMQTGKAYLQYFYEDYINR